jgi:hypothetical protein
MPEHKKDGMERKLPPLPRQRTERDRPWTREDFGRDLHKATQPDQDGDKQKK